jgi:hypothetical protein
MKKEQEQQRIRSTAYLSKVTPLACAAASTAALHELIVIFSRTGVFSGHEKRNRDSVGGVLALSVTDVNDVTGSLRAINAAVSVSM